MADKTSFAAHPPWRAILFMLAAVASFTLLDSTAKSLAKDLPVVEVVWARYVFSLLLFLLLFRNESLTKLWQTDRPWQQIGRALLLVGATAFIFFAVDYLPLAETYAISFVSPFLAALFAVLFLGEKIKAARWLAITAGFIGAVIVIQPGSGLYSWAVVFPLGMAVCWALYQIVTRHLSATEGPSTTLFFTMLVGAAVTTPVVPFFWVTPDWQSLILMACMGLIGLVGQGLLIKAYGLADASLLAPFAYTQIVWATSIGFLVFGDLPNTTTIIGVTVIILSGLLLIGTVRARS